MKPSFVNVDGADLARVQEEVQRTVEQLGDVCRSTLLSNVAIGTTSTAVAHGLRRTPGSYIVCRLRGDARVYEAAAPDSQAIYLQASAAVTVDVVVF
jgi:hypothetical protein